VVVSHESLRYEREKGRSLSRTPTVSLRLLSFAGDLAYADRPIAERPGTEPVV